MPLMTLDDIKEKAPDRKAYAAAKKVATDSKWARFGRQDKILWGVAKGSSGEYSVFVDTERDALECSCPSRKRPCKHALALLILDANEHDIPDAAPPDGHRWEAEDRYYSSWE